jgi:hypothetical protein
MKAEERLVEYLTKMEREVKRLVHITRRACDDPVIDQKAWLRVNYYLDWLNALLAAITDGKNGCQQRVVTPAKRGI